MAGLAVDVVISHMGFVVEEDAAAAVRHEYSPWERLGRFRQKVTPYGENEQGASDKRRYFTQGFPQN